MVRLKAVMKIHNDKILLCEYRDTLSIAKIYNSLFPTKNI